MILVVKLLTGGGDEWAASGRSIAEPGFSNKETNNTMHAFKIVGATTRQMTWHPAFVKPSNNIYVAVFNMSHHLHKVHDNDKIYKSNHNTHNTVENYTTYSHYQATMKK